MANKIDHQQQLRPKLAGDASVDAPQRAQSGIDISVRSTDHAKPEAVAPDGSPIGAVRTGRISVVDLLSSVTARGKLSPIAPGSPSQRENDAQASTDSASSLGKRRLGQFVPGPMVEEVDLETAADARSGSELPDAGTASDLGRAFKGWVAAILCVLCLAVGGVVVYLALFLMSGGTERRQRDEVARVVEESATLKQQLARGTANESNLVGQIKALEGEIRRLREEKKTVETAAQTASHEATAARDDLKNAIRSLEVLKAKIAEPKKPTNPGGDSTALKPLPVRPDRSVLAELTSVILVPAPGGLRGLGQTQPPPWKTKFGNMDRIELLFPNGDSKQKMSGSRILIATQNGDDVVLNLQGTTEDTWIARFHIEAGTLSLVWNGANKDYKLAVQEIREILRYTAILGASDEKEWTFLMAFRDDESNLDDKQPARFSFPQQGKANVLRVPSDLANDVCLNLKGAGANAWKCRAASATTVALTNQRARVVTVSATRRANPAIDGSAQFTITSDWDLGKREYIARYKSTLLEYGKQVATFMMKEPPARANVLLQGKNDEAELAKEEGLRAARQDQAKLKQLKVRVMMFRRLSDLEKEAEEFQRIGPINGELCLPNGIPVARFVFVEVPENQRWKP